MVLEFWSEAEGKTLTVRYTRRFGRETVTVPSHVGDALVVEKTPIRRGNAYSFTEDGEQFVVNSIVAHGERYVSLYRDGEPVHEYCYARERAAAMYDACPAKYDSFLGFFLNALWADVLVAGFILTLTLLIVGLRFDVLFSVGDVAIVSASVFALGYLLAFSIHALVHFLIRAHMTRLGVTRPFPKRIKKR